MDLNLLKSQEYDWVLQMKNKIKIKIKSKVEKKKMGLGLHTSRKSLTCQNCLKCPEMPEILPEMELVCFSYWYAVRTEQSH